MKEHTPLSDGAWRWRKSSYSQANGNSACVEVAWRRSSYSEASGNSDCVELACAGLVRDSKNPAGPVLRAELPTLMAAAKAGRLDR